MRVESQSPRAAPRGIPTDAHPVCRHVTLLRCRKSQTPAPPEVSQSTRSRRMMTPRRTRHATPDGTVPCAEMGRLIPTRTAQPRNCCAKLLFFEAVMTNSPSPPKGILTLPRPTRLPPPRPSYNQPRQFHPSTPRTVPRQPNHHPSYPPISNSRRPVEQELPARFAPRESRHNFASAKRLTSAAFRVFSTHSVQRNISSPADNTTCFQVGRRFLVCPIDRRLPSEV